MLQRIQTVFLALTALFMVAGIFFPIWISPETEATYKLFPLQLSVIRETGTEVIYLPFCITAILMAAAATIAIMELRRYDDRILQIKMGTLNSLILMGVMICAVLLSNQLTGEHPVFEYGTGLYLDFAAVTCNWLAVRFIRRDEKMVRDSDRIR